MLIEINNDIYFIKQRIKEMDEGYKIFYNTKRKKYEIHNVNQIGNSYALTVPYNILDNRTVEFVKKTRIENRNALFEEIEKNNKTFELQTQKETKNLIESEINKNFNIKKYI